jgi:protein arginine kinase activator
MLCEDCRQRVSTIIHVEKSGGEKRAVRLCQMCVEKRGIPVPVLRNPIRVETILMDVLDHLDEDGTFDPRDLSDSEICTACGWSFGNLRETGLLGCPHCYSSFENKLMVLMQELHGSDSHLGKVYSDDGHRLDDEEDETILKAALEEAISMEEFEYAAQIRDRLRQIQKRKNR